MVTTRLTRSVLMIDHIAYHLWDSRGIDNWNAGEEVDQLIEEYTRAILNHNLFAMVLQRVVLEPIKLSESCTISENE